ncbi:MAG: phosphoribosylanthranilate isomerase [Nitrospinales bacterium]
MVRVKICGITSIEDLMIAERFGADAAGLLVGQAHPSPDFISLAKAKEICQSASPYTTLVMVTHLEDTKEIVRLAQDISCRVVQLHSDLSSEDTKKLRELLRPKLLFAKVSVENDSAIERAKALESCADGIVLDSKDPATGRVGGTGKVHDWNISARIVKESKIPVVLAGGLTPENVKQAILQVKPWAVDVNSGVKGADGKKSVEKVRSFVEAAKKAGMEG